MMANIQTVKDNAEIIIDAEQVIYADFYGLTYPAEYGETATRTGIEHVEESQRYEREAAAAAAAGNEVEAGRLEAKAAAADREAAAKLEKAKGEVATIVGGLLLAGERTDKALGSATTLVNEDDSSEASSIRTRIAAVPEKVLGMAAIAQEIDGVLPASRNITQLTTAANNFAKLREEFEKQSGVAQETAGMAETYYYSQ